jgi:hypothetical protein
VINAAAAAIDLTWMGKAVGGQEDLIIEVAAGLRRAR